MRTESKTAEIVEERFESYREQIEAAYRLSENSTWVVELGDSIVGRGDEKRLLELFRIAHIVDINTARGYDKGVFESKLDYINVARTVDGIELHGGDDE